MLSVVKNGLEFDQLFGLRNWQLAVKQGVEQRKNGGARPDAERKSEHGDCGKTQGFAEHAESVAQILNKRFHAGARP